jgi:hypothetical protein
MPFKLRQPCSYEVPQENNDCIPCALMLRLEYIEWKWKVFGFLLFWYIYNMFHAQYFSYIVTIRLHTYVPYLCRYSAIFKRGLTRDLLILVYFLITLALSHSGSPYPAIVVQLLRACINQLVGKLDWIKKTGLRRLSSEQWRPGSEIIQQPTRDIVCNNLIDRKAHTRVARSF